MAKIQRLMMPMYNVGISQKEKGAFSHPGINAIDLYGKNTGIEKAYAPCDCKVIKKYAYAGMGNAVVFQSIKKVLYPDGTINYATFMMMHDNKISDIKIGQTFKQGVKCYDEGTFGYATGNHIHFEIAKGKYQGLASNGWSLKGNMNTQNALFLLKGKHKIINLLGNKYKVVDSLIYDDKATALKPVAVAAYMTNSKTPQYRMFNLYGSEYKNRQKIGNNKGQPNVIVTVKTTAGRNVFDVSTGKKEDKFKKGTYKIPVRILKTY